MVTSIIWSRVTVTFPNIHILLNFKILWEKCLSIFKSTNWNKRFSFLVHNFFPIIEHVFLTEEAILYKLSKNENYLFLFLLIAKIACFHLPFFQSPFQGQLVHFPKDVVHFLPTLPRAESWFCSHGRILEKSTLQLRRILAESFLKDWESRSLKGFMIGILQPLRPKSGNRQNRFIFLALG